MPDLALQHPAVVAHARLVVIGGDSHRLHEEIITAGGQIREGRFVRFGVAAGDAGHASPRRPTKSRPRRSRRSCWPSGAGIAEPLRQALEARTRDRTDGLKKMLAERAEKEAADITAILTELQTGDSGPTERPRLSAGVPAGIGSSSSKSSSSGTSMPCGARLGEIPGEIEKETEAIRARFADPQPRMFPVAVTFLVPGRLAREGR